MDETAFAEAFRHGELLRRELRLTDGEAAGLKNICPAVLTPLGDGWYDVVLQEAYQ